MLLRQNNDSTHTSVQKCSRLYTFNFIFKGIRTIVLNTSVPYTQVLLDLILNRIRRVHRCASLLFKGSEVIINTLHLRSSHDDMVPVQWRITPLSKVVPCTCSNSPRTISISMNCLRHHDCLLLFTSVNGFFLQIIVSNMQFEKNWSRMFRSFKFIGSEFFQNVSMCFQMRYCLRNVFPQVMI